MSDEKRKCSTCGETVWFGIEVVRPTPHSEGGELYHFGACIPQHLRNRLNDEPSPEDKL
jgi:hypothetical protein